MTNSPVVKQKTEHMWRAAVVRLSVFFLPENPVDASSWWDTIVAEPPENRNLQPRAGTRQEEGPFEGGRLVLTVQPDRADWVFIPAFDQQAGTPAFDRLPDYDSALRIFRPIAERYFKISPQPARLAFGAVLNSTVPDRPTGYRLLAQYLNNVKIDPDNSSDFHYQINRRRVSKNIAGLLINRLSKWSVTITKFSQFALGPVIQEFVISNH